MSKLLIKHLWRTNREQILRNSLSNCHAVGVNSIVLLDEPGRRIRLFTATKNHELYRNGPLSLSEMSVAFHPHHCDIDIEVIKGPIINRIFRIDENGPLRLTAWRYHSKLRGEQPGFEEIGPVHGFGSRMYLLDEGHVSEMKSTDIHTIVTGISSMPAWLIYEGAEDPNYQPVCYSDADLTQWTGEGMYQPMTEAAVTATIEGLL